VFLLYLLIPDLLSSHRFGLIACQLVEAAGRLSDHFDGTVSAMVVWIKKEFDDELPVST
jgi:hypothetical protein